MPRHARSPFAVLAVVLLLTAAGCGSGEATQGSVLDQVKRGLLASAEHDLSDAEAGEVADCVARGMFESGDFTPDERDRATSSLEGEEPSPALVTKVQGLFNRCLSGQ